MKLIKCRLSITIVLSLVFSFAFCMEANALFGNTHYSLAKLIIGKENITIPESNKIAFLSGIVYADIGRFKFDKETGVDSDSLAFAEAMKKFAKTSDEKWFVRGIEIHILQDKETEKLLKSIFKTENVGYSDYVM